MAGHQDDIRFLLSSAAKLREVARRCAKPVSDELLDMARTLEARATDLKGGKEG